jgi:Flp pilus assembly protein TadD
VHTTISPCPPEVEPRRRLLESARQHLGQRRLPEAAKAYAALLALEPDCVEALGQLGFLLFQFGLYAESLACLQKAVHVAPTRPKLHLLLGAVLRKLGRWEESADCCLRETKISPADADAHYNLGLALQSRKRPREALTSFRQALSLRPDYVDAIVDMGLALRQTGDDLAALESFERAIVLEPGNAEAHWESSTILLSQGRFERGWQEYEWRWKLKDRATPPARFEQPLWDGKDLGGRRILLHCEQGFGDVIQFSRYAALVAECHGSVILGCPESLRPIMATVRGVTEVAISRRDHPPFDVQVPLMSLPAIFGTTVETVPRQIPYLRAPAAKPASPPWVKDAPGLKVGLVWAAESASPNARIWSLPLDSCEPLLALPGIQWYSLQVGAAAEALATPAVAGRFADLGRRFADFGDTARAIGDLDLVISVDTCVAHLAGALGKPVWTLLPFDADWRWMLERADSPWYPTMRLLRQSRRGDWPGVISQVEAALRDLRCLPRHSDAEAGP